MAGSELGHSKKVRRRFLLDTTVTGPRTSTRLCLLNFFTSDCAPLREGAALAGTGPEHCADLDQRRLPHARRAHDGDECRRWNFWRPVHQLGDQLLVLPVQVALDLLADPAPLGHAERLAPRRGQRQR